MHIEIGIQDYDDERSMRKALIIVNDQYYTIYENGTIIGSQGMITPRMNEDGYLVVTLGEHGNRSMRSVHRLVAMAFVPNPHNYPEVDHIDGNRQNPAASNLEWVTHQENIKRAWKKGRYSGRYIGEKNPKARVTEDIVRMLRMEYQCGATIRELHKKYNVAESAVGNIVHRYTWKHIK